MNFFQRLGWKLRQWMQGRYGTDALNLVLVGAGLVCSLFGRNMVLYLCSLAFLTLALLRMFSRNIPARHFRCPKCHQKVRVPRGKGKIQITCPKCGEKFIKKT